MSLRGGVIALACTAGLLASCNDGGKGYVEIKTVPSTSMVAAPTLYIDAVKIEPLRKGSAVLKQNTGIARLQIDGPNGQLVLLCELMVKKNRITTVTLSVLERPPRCQCRHDPANPTQRACLS